MAQSSGRPSVELERVIEAEVENLGFEVVDLEQAGHRSRPLLRLRIDRPGSAPGRGVTVDDCARVSRRIEEIVEAREDLPGSYILEVSSPGVERPLRKRRDFERCVGKQIALKGLEPLVGGSKRVEGVLVAVEGADEAAALRLRLRDATEMEIPLSAVAKAKLVFSWDDPASGRSHGRV